MNKFGWSGFQPESYSSPGMQSFDSSSLIVSQYKKESMRREMEESLNCGSQAKNADIPLTMLEPMEQLLGVRSKSCCPVCVHTDSTRTISWIHPGHVISVVLESNTKMYIFSKLKMRRLIYFPSCFQQIITRRLLDCALISSQVFRNMYLKR